MYQRSPMENYNKNNPFIVIAKKKYDAIIDGIQSFGRDCIRISVINFIIWLILVCLQNYIAFVTANYIIANFVISITLAINALTIYRYRKRIEYFISAHPSMQKFDKLSALEVNDILILNNEDILKCVHGLYELHGELKATKDYYDLFLKLYIVTELFVVAISMIAIDFIL